MDGFGYHSKIDPMLLMQHGIVDVSFRPRWSRTRFYEPWVDLAYELGHWAKEESSWELKKLFTWVWQCGSPAVAGGLRKLWWGIVVVWCRPNVGLVCKVFAGDTDPNFDPKDWRRKLHGSGHHEACHCYQWHSNLTWNCQRTRFSVGGVGVGRCLLLKPEVSMIWVGHCPPFGRENWGERLLQDPGWNTTRKTWKPLKTWQVPILILAAYSFCTCSVV